MKKILLAAIAALFAAEADGQTGQTSISAHSAYIGRNGLPQSEGSAIQADAAISHRSFSGSLWASYGLPEGCPTEINIVGSVDSKLRTLDLTLGTTIYHYPNGSAPNTQEVFAELRHSGRVNGSILGVYDFIDGNGGMAVLTLDRDFSVRGISLAAMLSAAYSHNYFWSQSDLTHLTSGISAELPVGKATIGAYFNAQKSLHAGFGNEAYGGLTLECRL
ncbi:MAG: hypothetical protein ABH879_06045 [archaeon]